MVINLTRGERFKEARLTYNRHGKQTMADVESATGINSSMITALENDDIQRNVGYDYIVTLAAHYGVSTDFLLGLSEHPTVSEDMKTAIKVTGLSEKAIKNAQECNSWLWILSKMMESDGFCELIVDIENLYEIVGILEEKYSAFVAGEAPQKRASEYSPLVQAVLSQTERISQPEDELIPLYDEVRLEKYELLDSFGAIIEKMIPTKELLSSVKKVLREYGGLSAFSSYQEGVEHGGN